MRITYKDYEQAIARQNTLPALALFSDPRESAAYGLEQFRKHGYHIEKKARWMPFAQHAAVRGQKLLLPCNWEQRSNRSRGKIVERETVHLVQRERNQSWDRRRLLDPLAAWRWEVESYGQGCIAEIRYGRPYGEVLPLADTLADKFLRAFIHMRMIVRETLRRFTLLAIRWLIRQFAPLLPSR